MFVTNLLYNLLKSYETRYLVIEIIESMHAYTSTLNLFLFGCFFFWFRLIEPWFCLYFPCVPIC